MNPEQFREIYQQNFYYIVAAGVVIGLLFGAIPLVVGIRRKKKKLGFIGFICSAVAGGFGPPIGILVAGVFLVLVMRKASTKTPAGEDADPPTLPK